MKPVSFPLWLEISAGILVVLLLSNGLTLLVAEQRRLSAARSERFRSVEARIDAFADLYRRVPAEGRAQLLSLASVRHERLAVGTVPRVAFSSDRDGVMEDRLRRVLALPQDADVRVTKRGRPELSLVEQLHPRQQERFAVAVALGNGEWLNGEFYWPVGESLLPGILFSGAVSAIMLVLLSVWIARRLAAPLRQLADAADQIQQGKPFARLPQQGPAPLRQTLASFNLMAQRMVPLVDSQRMVLASVGHDLRTPISSLRLKSEFIDDEELRNSFSGSLDELQCLTEAALQVARDGVSHELPRCVDLMALVESLCEDLIDLGENVSFVPDQAVEVRCRPNEIRRAVRNLIENAIKYAGSAEVVVRACGDQVLVEVSDRGPGLPAGALDQVFAPFTRGMAQDRPGHGLGLTLARAIARAHGGDVRLENRTGGGLKATLSLAWS